MRYKIIALILIMLVFSACKLNSTQSDNVYIGVSNIKNIVSFKGYIRQRPFTKLYFQTEGKISFLPYHEGDYVKKGQVLARLDGMMYKIKKDGFKLEDEVNYNIITAPYDGYIEKIYTSLNSYIKKNQTVLTIYPCNKTEAEAMVEAKYINKINLKKGAIVEHKNSVYEAKISNISKDNDKYLIELELNNLYKELKEGTNVVVEFDLSP